VTEGREIPDGSLVLGAPAKVARALSEEDIAQMSKAAEKYQWNQRRFREGVTEI
jgi:carbonic anhydrase/acetyltransferase-like protein (isoleucine patch superfamily)